MKKTLACLMVLFLSVPAAADTIVLKNGSRIKASQTWEDGGKIHYQKFGQVIAIPMANVVRVERAEKPEKKEAQGQGFVRRQESPIRLTASDRMATPEDLDAEYQALVEEKRKLREGRSAMDSSDYRQKKRALLRRFRRFALKTGYCFDKGAGIR